MSLVLKTEVKQLFFDRDRVIRATDRAQRRALSRVGGFVRKTAKRSIRKSKKKSTPGNPPRSHSGELRGGIWFSYDQQRKSVVIGPVSFGTNVPNVLEFGGAVKIKTDRGVDPSRKETVTIKARPFMGPAEKIARQEIPDAFKDAVRS